VDRERVPQAGLIADRGYVTRNHSEICRMTLLAQRLGHALLDRLVHAGHRQQVRRFLDGLPIFLGHQHGTALLRLPAMTTGSCDSAV